MICDNCGKLIKRKYSQGKDNYIFNCPHCGEKTRSRKKYSWPKLSVNIKRERTKEKTD